MKNRVNWIGSGVRSPAAASRGLSARFVVLASMLLFTLVFLSVNGEAPRWPFAVAAGAAGLVTGLYWMFFRVLGGCSLGARLSRLAENDTEENEEVKAARFR